MILAALLLTVHVSAASPLDDGKAQWSVMEIERAAALFESAVRTAKSDDERAHAYVWLGVARAELGDFSVAKNAFMNALRLRADIALPSDVGEIPPRVRGLFEAAKLELEGPRPLPRDAAFDANVDEPANEAEHGPLAPRAPAPAAASPTRDDATPILVVGAVALAGSGLMLLGVAAVLDVAAGPELLDGGTMSIACLGAGTVTLLAGGGLGIAAALAE